MAALTIDRFLALAVRRGFITRAQLEDAIRALGIRACLEHNRVRDHLVANGALTKERVAELEKLLRRRDFYCPACHSVQAVETKSSQRENVCNHCKGPLRAVDGMDVETQLKIEDIFREAGPDPVSERAPKFGRYRLVRLLGRGAMGAVYLGADERLNRPVAIKLVPDDLAHDADLLKRFLREGRAMARLRHPNVVQVYDVDEVRGRHFIVMEYIDGPSIDTLIRQAGRIAPRPAAKFAYEIACGLNHCHREGLLHRDVKPGNVLVTRGGIAKLVDFGLSRPAGKGSTTITISGLILGTPHYISPEGAEARPVDERSDLYSLGVSIYHMLSGRRPYDGMSALAVLVQHVDCIPPPLPPDLPKPLVKIVEHMMQKHPDDRPQNAGEVVKALKEWLQAP